MKNPLSSVAFFTLGCKVNQNETDSMAELFRSRGYKLVDFEENADVYVINTCTVTNSADHKSRQVIKRCVKEHPQALIAAVGCYTQIAAKKMENILGVDLILGTTNKHHIVDFIEEINNNHPQVAATRIELDDIAQCSEYREIGPGEPLRRARAYLKIQDGCEQYCTYCIIPYTRGPLRSRLPDNIYKEIDHLIDAGYKEVVLTGIHLGMYGVDLDQPISLGGLLKRLLEKSKDIRFRIGSLEPMELTPEIIDIIKNSGRICSHLHLPLQSGHNDILRAMNRPYTTEDYQRVVDSARTAVPGISITTDIMVGFPGETDEHFSSAVDFVKNLGFSAIHVFKYSPREGTLASTLRCQIGSDVKERRSSQMRELARRMSGEYICSCLGKTYKVLAEQELQRGIWVGHSENYLQVHFESANIKRGHLAEVRLKSYDHQMVFGEEV